MSSNRWAKTKKVFPIALMVALFPCAYFSHAKGGLKAAAITALSALCLALGLWFTENLVAVFTKVKTANPTAMVLLVMGKMLWWVGLFLLMRSLPRGQEFALSLGFGSFLFALLCVGLAQAEWPKISSVNQQ